jgi:V/A-type H+-transporting ATPase subunit A
VRSLWALDTKRAQARFYPAIHPLQSYSEDAAQLAGWWDKIYAPLPPASTGASQASGEWAALRRQFLSLLDEQARIERMARIIGKDALPARQQLTLTCAELVNEAFLRQSAFSETDRYCGPERQARMMRLLVRFIALAEAALAAGHKPERIARMHIVRLLQRMGEDIPEGAPERHFELETSMDAEFRALGARAESHAT